MDEWPHCLTESETLDQLLLGKSIARFGDGELGIALGGGTATHQPHPALRKEMNAVLKDPGPNCIAAIPTMDKKSPRYDWWNNHRPRYLTILDLSKTYGSAFVGQTRSAPWIGNAEHADRFRSVWAGKRVVAVQANTGGLSSLLERDAAEIEWVFCPQLEAYSEIDRLEEACLNANADIAVLVAGPCATILASRLSRNGLQAIDLGRGVGVILRNMSP